MIQQAEQFAYSGLIGAFMGIAILALVAHIVRKKRPDWWGAFLSWLDY